MNVPETPEKLAQRQTIRFLLTELAQDSGHNFTFSDSESLFLSGKLDSLAAVKLVMTLESKFQVDVDGASFDISSFDSVEQILGQVAQSSKRT
jgi:acyl carrier protein